MSKTLLTGCSDILAELDLPRSGIQDIREVAYPNDYLEPGDREHWNSDQLIMAYYSGQIHIRNALNDIQQDLYAPESESLSPDFVLLKCPN